MHPPVLSRPRYNLREKTEARSVPYPLPDRQRELFGREGDVMSVLAHCRYRGVTVLTGRPRLGKSWLLMEVGRRLHGMNFVVGYAESTGEEADLLLRAVADGYERWLAVATATEQAASLLDRHRDKLVGLGGTAVGELLGAVGGLVGWNQLSGLAAATFSGLAVANKKLKTGGLELPRLGYEQARDLVRMLAQVTNKGVVLILDAWEKMPSIARETGLLDSYLRHVDDWPDGHVLVGLRVEDDDDETVKRVRRVVRGFADAREYPLEGMDLQQVTERQRLLSHVRDELGRVTDGVDDELLENLIDRFPGVVEWWKRPAVKDALRTVDDLRRAAADAQAARYRPEFDRVLVPLQAEDAALFKAAVRRRQ